MTGDAVAPLEQAVDIAAPIDAVWALVSDVRRMNEWSPQVTSTRLSAGFDDVSAGTRFTNRNAHGELVWTTHAEVVAFTAPGQTGEVAFRVDENWVVWSFHLAATDAGTRLTQRREAPHGISPLSLGFTDDYLGGYDAFTASQLAGMRETLEAIKAAAER